MEKRAIFAGRCFWCMVKPFEKVEGVKIKDDEIINKIEVRSKNSDIHLGYLVNDTLRDFRNRVLSINSSALKFISKDKTI